MKRTPQPTLTQSKLTSMIQPRSSAESGSQDDSGRAAPRAVSLDVVEMDTSSAIPATAPNAGAAIPLTGAAMVTTDFLLKALKENSDHLIKSFNASLGALSVRIDDNASRITSNSTAIASQAAVSVTQQAELESLNNRVLQLERGKPDLGMPLDRKASLGPGYMRARRSVRLWPIHGDNDDELWPGVGEFLHGALAIPEDLVSQEDIESIVRVVGSRGQPDRKEAIVTFFDKQQRDLVVSNSPSLANKIDRDGRPTAGIRMEVPPELEDTFRLLHRFGARLRARHGAGTKRHIKFDDFEGSLYTNIKLPGDSAWTKVTPAMAREDLGASLREENSNTQKRLASKLVPGPRERLGRPMEAVRMALPARVRGTPPPIAPDPAGPGPVGKRPRWSAPDRRPL